MSMLFIFARLNQEFQDNRFFVFVAQSSRLCRFAANWKFAVHKKGGVRKPNRIV